MRTRGECERSIKDILSNHQRLEGLTFELPDVYAACIRYDHDAKDLTIDPEDVIVAVALQNLSFQTLDEARAYVRSQLGGPSYPSMERFISAVEIETISKFGFRYNVTNLHKTIIKWGDAECAFVRGPENRVFRNIYLARDCVDKVMREMDERPSMPPYTDYVYINSIVREAPLRYRVITPEKFIRDAVTIEKVNNRNGEPVDRDKLQFSSREEAEEYVRRQLSEDIDEDTAEAIMETAIDSSWGFSVVTDLNTVIAEHVARIKDEEES